jgi:hypothetical protein
MQPPETIAMANAPLVEPGGCPSCNAPMSSLYCSNCGQKAYTGRLTVKKLLLNGLNNIFNLEKGILYTIKELILRPQEVIVGYINGRTVNQYNPFRLLLVIGSLYAFVLVTTGAFDVQSELIAEYGTNDPEARANQEKMIGYVKQFSSFLSFVLVPFYAFGSKLMFKRASFNFAEHLVAVVYAYAIVTLLSTAITLVLFQTDTMVVQLLVTVTTTIAIAVVLAKTFRSSYGMFSGIMRGILSTVFGVVFFFIALSIIMLVVGIVVGLFSKMI